DPGAPVLPELGALVHAGAAHGRPRQGRHLGHHPDHLELRLLRRRWAATGQRLVTATFFRPFLKRSQKRGQDPLCEAPFGPFRQRVLTPFLGPLKRRERLTSTNSTQKLECLFLSFSPPGSDFRGCPETGEPNFQFGSLSLDNPSCFCMLLVFSYRFV